MFIKLVYKSKRFSKKLSLMTRLLAIPCVNNWFCQRAVIVRRQIMKTMLRLTKMQLWYPHKQVVDARAGPGMKSFTKFKTKKKKLADKMKKMQFER